MRQTTGFKRNTFGKVKEASIQNLKKGEPFRFKAGQYKTEPGHSGFKHVYRQYKIGAGQRGIDFMLSESDVKRLTKSNCYYCNTAPSQTAYCAKQRTKEAAERSRYIYNGIDRIDNLKPYVLENCVPCCTTCNRAKGTKTLNEFISYLNNLITNYGGAPFHY